MNNSNRKTLSLDDLIELDKNKRDEDEGKQSDNIIDNKDKFYLPVLSMNEPDFWPSLSKSKRKLLTDENATNACLKNCCGNEGIYSGCCRLDPDDLENILGPISEKWIKGFIKDAKKNKQNLKRNDIVIDFEEGEIVGNTFFNGHKIFMDRNSYPMLRFQIHGPRFACKFLNTDSGTCSIYKQRPDRCKNYYCEYLKRNFLIKTGNSNNTYKMIDDRRWQCFNCGTYNKHSSQKCNFCTSTKEE